VRVAAIVVHTAAGVLAFGFGLTIIGAARDSRRPLRFRAYQASLVVLVATLLLAIALDWGDLDSGTRVAFSLLVVLALFMVWRADRAGRLRTDASVGARQTLIDHVGFTLVALFDGFVIVSAIDLDLPAWAVVVIGVLGVAIGHRATVAARRSIA
jgi:hypothetical protein